MKTSCWLTMAGSVAVILGLAAPAQAIDITIPDNNTGAWGFGGGARGTGGEDNETEPGTVASQKWDLEAMTIVGKKLSLFGGWNFNTGDVGPGLTGYRPGDLFIKVGGPAPTGNPITPGYGTIANSTYGYTYAVLLNGGLGSSAVVQTLSASSILNTVYFDQFVSNPWTYANGASASASAPITYTTGLSDGAIASGYSGLSLLGGTHNVLSIDLSFLGAVASGTPVWFSYTMECGNDSMKGYYNGGFRTPDGGMTVLLLGMALSVLGMAGSKLRAT